MRYALKMQVTYMTTAWWTIKVSAERNNEGLKLTGAWDLPFDKPMCVSGALIEDNTVAHYSARIRLESVKLRNKQHVLSSTISNISKVQLYKIPQHKQTYVAPKLPAPSQGWHP